jgi:hypothetical protein
MTTLIWMTVVLPVLGAAPRTSEKMVGDAMFVFATVEEGKKILTARDEFVRALSPFDRASRLKTDKDVSEADYLVFVGRNVLNWTDADKERVGPILDVVKTGLARFPLPLPKTIYLIKTTGEEEGHAAYTQGSGLVFPTSLIPPEPRLVYHELFHILSRANPELREKLYKAIGFVKCAEVELPEKLKVRKITNPDGPRNDHCIAVQVAGEPVWAVPLLLSRSERYDPNRGGEFFDYMEHQFLIVTRDSNSPPPKMSPAGQEPRLVSQAELSGFFEQIGRNTEYTIHPDEILADDFASLMMQDRNVRSPEILKKMEAILSAKPTTEVPAGAN